MSAYQRVVGLGVVAFFFAMPGCSGEAATTENQGNLPAVDVTARSVAQIPPGTQIANGPPAGWSNLIYIAYPRLAQGDVDSLPAFAKDLASFLTAAMVANVVREDVDGQALYRLERVAFGLGTNINGQNTIITADTQKKLGADLSLFKSQSLSMNESGVKTNLKQVARTRNMAVLDMKGYILYKGKHKEMTIRYCIVVPENTGRLTTLVWLLDPQPNNTFQLAEPQQVQVLPANMREDRIVDVDGDKVNLIGIPSAEAFALAKIPQGTPLPFTPRLRMVAAMGAFSVQTTLQLEAAAKELSQSQIR